MINSSTPRLVCVLVLALSLTACGRDLTGEGAEPGPVDTTDFTFVPAENTARVRVEFSDASVPPAEHRSWVLLFDRQEINLVVDSYGDVVGEKTAAMPPQLWQRFRERVPVTLASLPETVEISDCPGGRAIALSVSDAGEFVDREVSATCSCGADDEANDQVFSDILSLVEPMTDQVDLERLTGTG